MKTQTDGQLYLFPEPTVPSKIPSATEEESKSKTKASKARASKYQRTWRKALDAAFHEKVVLPIIIEIINSGKATTIAALTRAFELKVGCRCSQSTMSAILRTLKIKMQTTVQFETPHLQPPPCSPAVPTWTPTDTTSVPLGTTSEADESFDNEVRSDFSEASLAPTNPTKPAKTPFGVIGGTLRE